MEVPNVTYIDDYIADGQNATLTLQNFYDTVLIKDDDHSFRVPIGDFFVTHMNDFSSIVQYHTIPQTMFYKPKALSLEVYGTTELWLAIMRLNGMRNITEFHQPIIKLWNSDALKELINIYFKRDGKK